MTFDIEADIRGEQHRIISICFDLYERRLDTEIKYETRPGTVEVIQKGGYKYYYHQYKYDIKQPTNSILGDRLGGCANFVSFCQFKYFNANNVIDNCHLQVEDFYAGLFDRFQIEKDF